MGNMITNAAYTAQLCGSKVELKDCENCGTTNLRQHLKEEEFYQDFELVKKEICYFCRKRYRLVD